MFGSVCSGIEAASCAWHPLGWRAAFVSEIDRFPSAVLAHHYPNVPNLGDMTKFKEWPDAAIDVLVGGTPCQSFSVAGLRKGLADPRGNLMLTYLAIAERHSPRWLVWENVPGVLSSNNGRDFGALLHGLGQLGYGFAYRVLDAQHFGVPQRRRRVFVVGHLGDWRRAAAVLFERESMSGNPAPRRQARQDVAPAISARTQGGGGLGTDFDCDGGLIARTLLGKSNSSHAADQETYVAHALRAEGFDASEDGTGRGTPIVPVAIQAGALRENPASGPDGIGVQSDCAYTLEARAEVQAVAFDCKASGQSGFGVGEIASTLRSMGHADSHQNGGGHQAVAIFDERNVTSPDNRSACRPDGAVPTLHTSPLSVAFDMRGREGGAQFEGPHDTANIRSASGGSSRSYVAGMQVRRLTPRECERLQGFPDDYTLIESRGKPAADGPRYKALGNSMAVPVMRWIGERIQSVHNLTENHQ